MSHHTQMTERAVCAAAFLWEPDIRRLMTDARRSQDTKESKLCGLKGFPMGLSKERNHIQNAWNILKNCINGINLESTHST